MKILFLTSRIPYPPNRGDRLRVFNFIRSLSDEHEIHLVSFIESEHQRERTKDLNVYCSQIHLVPLSALASILNVFFNIWRKYPLQALFYRSRKMKRLLSELLHAENFDLIYIHLFRMAPYLEEYSQIYKVVDLTDVVSKEMELSIPYRNGLSKLVYRIEKDRVRKYELDVVRNFDESWLISKADALMLEQAVPDAKINIVRNGVDTDTFHPLDAVEKHEKQLIFVGHMSVPHNVDAAVYLTEEIYPLLKVHYPNLNLVLAGAHPNPKIESLSKIGGVKVTGFVEDLNQVLNESMIFVAPLRFAAGVQNKVLEACAAGVPVVTSKMVGEGIGLTDGVNVLYAAGAENFAQQIRKLLDNPEMQKDLANNAREFVLRHYNWLLVNSRISEIQKIL